MTGSPSSWSRTSSAGWRRATADQIAEAMVGQWPRLVFVSGCLTGRRPRQRHDPVDEREPGQGGSPGWSWGGRCRSGDVSATEFAAQLYRALAAGQPLDRAVVRARQAALHRQEPQLASAAGLRRQVAADADGDAR